MRIWRWISLSFGLLFGQKWAFVTIFWCFIGQMIIEYYSRKWLKSSPLLFFYTSHFCCALSWLAEGPMCELTANQCGCLSLPHAADQLTGRPCSGTQPWSHRRTWRVAPSWRWWVKSTARRTSRTAGGRAWGWWWCPQSVLRAPLWKVSQRWIMADRYGHVTFITLLTSIQLLYYSLLEWAKACYI